MRINEKSQEKVKTYINRESSFKGILLYHFLPFHSYFSVLTKKRFATRHVGIFHMAQEIGF